MPLGCHPVVTEHTSIVRFLESLGEPTSAPERSPARGPPYWTSTVLRRKPTTGRKIMVRQLAPR